jgi:hypothetical protein
MDDGEGVLIDWDLATVMDDPKHKIRKQRTVRTFCPRICPVSTYLQTMPFYRARGNSCHAASLRTPMHYTRSSMIESRASGS